MAAPRDPVAQDEVPQTLPSLVSLRNMRNPAPGLTTALVNFAHLVQHLERELSSEPWSTSDAEDEQGGHLGRGERAHAGASHSSGEAPS